MVSDDGTGQQMVSDQKKFGTTCIRCGR